MKPLALNMSKMKKIAGDKNSSTFLHDDGHQMIIAHAKLPALQRKQLERLPLAEGGEVDKSKQDLSVGDEMSMYQHGKDVTNDKDRGQYKAQKQIQQETKLPMYADGGMADLAESLSKSFNNPKPTPQPTPETRDEKYARIREQNTQNVQGYAHGGEANNPKLQQSHVDNPVPEAQKKLQFFDDGGMAAPAPQQNPASVFGQQPVNVPQPNTPPVTQNLNPNGTLNAPAAFQLQQKAGREQQAVDSAKGAAMADVERGYIQQQAEQAKRDQERFNNFAAHTDEAANAIKQGLINPDHYMESKGSAGKVNTAFGLALGSVGAAFTGGPNMAYDFLNKQIDRDIDAQKARSDQQKTIFGMYKNAYENGNVASDLTKKTMLDIYSHKAQQVAAQLGTPQAKAMADAYSAKAAMEGNQLLLDASQNANIETANPGQKPSGQNNTPSAPQQQGQPESEKPNPENEYADSPILSPNAQQHLNSLRYTPKAKEEIDQIKTQYTQAQQADQLLNQLHNVHQQMAKQAKEGGGSGFIRRHDPVSDIPLGIGPFINKALVQPITATPNNKAYDTNKTRIVGDIANALKGTNVGGEEIQKIVDANSPEPHDPPELIKQKERNIRLFIKNSVNKSLLKDWGLSK